MFTRSEPFGDQISIFTHVPLYDLCRQNDTKMKNKQQTARIRGGKVNALVYAPSRTRLFTSFLSRRRSIYHRPSFTRSSEMPRSGGKAESASSLSPGGSSGVVRSCTHHLFIGSDPTTFDRAAFTSCGVVPNIQN